MTVKELITLLKEAEPEWEVACMKTGVDAKPVTGVSTDEEPVLILYE